MSVSFPERQALLRHLDLYSSPTRVVWDRVQLTTEQLHQEEVARAKEEAARAHKEEVARANKVVTKNQQRTELNEKVVTGYDALRKSLGLRGSLMVDVPSDHQCLYAACLHAFCTQLPSSHPARQEAEAAMQTSDPAATFRLSLITYAGSEAAQAAMCTTWDCNLMGRETPTLEACLLGAADKLDYTRSSSQQTDYTRSSSQQTPANHTPTLAGLLDQLVKMKSWGSELILAYLLPLRYDVRLQVLQTTRKGTDVALSEFNIPKLNCLHYHPTIQPTLGLDPVEDPAFLRQYPCQYSVLLANITDEHFTSSVSTTSQDEYSTSWKGLLLHLRPITAVRVGNMSVDQLKGELKQLGGRLGGNKDALRERLLNMAVKTGGDRWGWGGVRQLAQKPVPQHSASQF